MWFRLDGVHFSGGLAKQFPPMNHEAQQVGIDDWRVATASALPDRLCQSCRVPSRDLSVGTGCFPQADLKSSMHFTAKPDMREPDKLHKESSPTVTLCYQAHWLFQDAILTDLFLV